VPPEGTNSATYLESLFGLAGKAAVVTGGGGLIGSEFCRTLGRAGAKVAILGRTASSLEAVSAEISAFGGTSLPFIADVLDEESLDRARELIIEKFGGVDILVNCAGGPLEGARLLPNEPLFGGAFREGTRRVIELNLLGTVLPIFAFGDILASADGGVIVNVSSGSARHVSPGVMGYSAAKAGVEQLTRWLAVEAARRYGGRVRVNAISPGFTLGDGTRPLSEGKARQRARHYNSDGSPTEFTTALLEHIPVGRLGEPADLASALLWLCGPASSYVNGVVVSVDGGHGL
jgi:NAD(P)-dependent dehydrogenase (short-subunit alcohol dehydrogenase family)